MTDAPDPRTFYTVRIPAQFNRALEDLRVNPTLDPEVLRFREEARQLFGR